MRVGQEQGDRPAWPCVPAVGRADHAIDTGSPSRRAYTSVVIVIFVWDSDRSFDARARIETAVGVLMELCGWEANNARSRLISAAVTADAPVEKVATAILALGPEHPGHGGGANFHTAATPAIWTGSLRARARHVVELR